jgi:2-polyprenyl-6-methoxyphenol hydroxylase-like FAD-dependent oxidoreductase
MYRTEVGIIGGGLAGSLAAAMLGRRGIDCVLIDPHPAYPDDFRCEKLDGPQMAILRKTGLAEAVLRASTPDRESWVARFGRIVEKRDGDQQGIFYTSLVNTIRAEIPANVRVIFAKATEIENDGEMRRVVLSNGECVEARLIVLANGLNLSLRDRLGLKREIISPCHSITVGFNMRPVGRQAFDFPALTAYAEDPSQRAALITMFPIGEAMRANLFVYRDQDDPLLRALRRDTPAALFSLMPSLRKMLGDFTVDGRVQIRSIDLYVTHGYRMSGVVLVGDAFSTSCPAAGTGARKALTDVERLCNHHIPQWLASPGMAVEKIAAFYDDPVKQECDDFSRDKAFKLKAFSLDEGLSGRTQRWVKFVGQATRGGIRATFPGILAGRTGSGGFGPAQGERV